MCNFRFTLNFAETSKGVKRRFDKNEKVDKKIKKKKINYEKTNWENLGVSQLEWNTIFDKDSNSLKKNVYANICREKLKPFTTCSLISVNQYHSKKSVSLIFECSKASCTKRYKLKSSNFADFIIQSCGTIGH